MSRGRPRKTDPEKVLQNAMLTFWMKGYDATSISDLSNKTGMAIPGLYNTFGNKEEIYSKALERYVSEQRNAHFIEIFQRGISVKDTFRTFYQALVETMCDPETPDGCLLVNTLLKSENAEPALKRQAKIYNDNRRLGLLAYLGHAHSNGNLSSENNVDELADYLSAQVITIAALHKIGTGRDELERYIETVLKIIRD